MSPPSASELLRTGMADHQAGRLDAAANRYAAVLAVDPGHADALHLSGLIAHQRGRPADALGLLRRAVAARPDVPMFWFNLAAALSAAGADAEAVAALTTAVGLDPAFADAHQSLANAQQRLDRPADAAATLTTLAQLRPTAAVLAQLGAALSRVNQHGPAADAFRRSLALRPGDPATRADLAGTLVALGQADAAVADYRQLIATTQLSPAQHSNALLAMLYAGADPAEQMAESQRWAATHAAPAPRPPAVHVAGRRVRVGYVSPDLYDHPVGHLITPLLAGHDRAAFEVHCYCDHRKADAVTARLRSTVEHWHETRALTDAALADRVRADGIDVLVDLAGHTAHHRLLAFARRPAAVQVGYLGYPATTGLPAIDARLTDAVADPPGVADDWHTERLVRLNCFVCFAPPDAPPVAPPPPSAGHVTFGSFNAAAKLGPATARLWGAVLAAVPRSRLVLKCVGLMDEGARRRFVAALGVDPARVDVLPPEQTRRDHLARYAAVDVALDPFPYHGTMTTLDALWMGVPTVTLAGPSHVSRVGASLMTHAGLGQFVADTPERFVAIAAAADGAALRSSMRDRLRASPLMAADRFVSDVESAYAHLLAGVA